MQPVLEIRKLADQSFTYSVRAPRSHGMLPQACYVDGGHPTLEACLLDASLALRAYFPRVYIRYQGLCVGEHELLRLNSAPVAVARELLANHLNRTGVPAAPMPA